jgi:hypothetical protein
MTGAPLQILQGGNPTRLTPNAEPVPKRGERQHANRDGTKYAGFRKIGWLFPDFEALYVADFWAPG